MPDSNHNNQYIPPNLRISPQEPISNSRIQYLTDLYSHQLSDAGNARRFVAQYGHQLRYLPTRGWFLYNGTRWTLDETNQVLDLALASLQSLYDDASALNNHNQTLCQRMLTHFECSQSTARLKALLTLATALPGVSLPASAFNADPYLLNFLNGTLDLRTRTLHPHTSTDFLTQLILTPYHPDATSTTLTTFLTNFTNNNPELLAYLQRAIGYSLTGLTSERCCFILTGTGQTAQDLFLTLLSSLFASYAAHLPTFQRRQLSPTLLNARLITTSTSTFLQNSDPLLLTTFIKAESYTLVPFLPVNSTYKPQATIWASLPNPPQLNSTLSHLRDRLKFIPISCQISNQEARQLELHLRDLLPALLAWVVQGAFQWLDADLAEPSIVTQTCYDYLDAQDGLSTFFETRCIRGTGYYVAAHELYEAYLLWCRDHHLSPFTENKFGRCLTDRKLKRVRHADCNTYYDITLVKAPQTSSLKNSSSAAALSTCSTYSKSETTLVDPSPHSTSPKSSASPEEALPSSPLSHDLSPLTRGRGIRSIDCPSLFGDPPSQRPHSLPERN